MNRTRFSALLYRNFGTGFLLGAFTMMCVTFFSRVAFGQDAVVPVSPDDISKFFAAMGGLKGAGTLVVVAFVVQAIMLVGRSAIGSLAGKWQLLIVNGLTLALGVITLKLQGMSWLAALVNAQTLAAAQVFAHQVYTQVTDKSTGIQQKAG